MQKMKWLESHIGSIESGIDLVNQFYWSLSVKERNGKWFVLTGEKVLLQTDSQDMVDTFLYGMALAYSIIPDDIIKRFREDHNPW